MRFGYAAHDGSASERRVEPYRLVATSHRWYLLAYDLGVRGLPEPRFDPTFSGRAR